MDSDLQARLDAVVNRQAQRQTPPPAEGSRRLWGSIDAVNADGTVDVLLDGAVVPDRPVLASGLLLVEGDYVAMENFRGDMIVLGRLSVGAADERSAKRLTRNVYPGTTHTMDLTDVNDVVQEFTSGSAIALTIPARGTTAWVDGDSSEVYAAGAGQITVAHASGSSHLRAPNGTKSAHQYAELFLRYRNEAGSDEWVLSGDVTT